jgi:hypothetical protein
MHVYLIVCGTLKVRINACVSYCVWYAQGVHFCVRFLLCVVRPRCAFVHAFLILCGTPKVRINAYVSYFV